MVNLKKNYKNLKFLRNSMEFNPKSFNQNSKIFDLAKMNGVNLDSNNSFIFNLFFNLFHNNFIKLEISSFNFILF